MTRTLLTVVFAIGLTGSIAHAQVSEGIKVRGQWTIDVRQPDGTLVEHREFDNGLIETLFLARAMAGQVVPGLWRVALGSRTSPCPSVTIPGAHFGGNRTACEIVQPGGQINDPAPSTGSQTLKVDLCVGSSNPSLACERITPKYAMVLTGHITAAAEGTIEVVATLLTECGGTSSPHQCRTRRNDELLQRPAAYSDSDYFYFTRASLDKAIGVSKGQIVQVKVVISFPGAPYPDVPQ